MIIREWDKTTPAEFEKILELNLLEWGKDFFGENVVEMTTEQYYDPTRTVLIAEVEGEIVGTASVVGRDVYDIYPDKNILQEKMGYFSRLVIAEAHRGKGIGSLLLAASDARAYQRGFEKLFLILAKDRKDRLYKFYRDRHWQEAKEIEKEKYGALLILTHTVLRNFA